MKTIPSALLALCPVLVSPGLGCGGPAGNGAIAVTTTSASSSTSSSGGEGGGPTSSGSSTSSSGSSTSSGSSGATSSSSSGAGSSSSGSTTITPMPKGCVTAVTAGHHVFSCTGGVTYDVRCRAACAAGGCGLVLDFHGYTMNAAQEDLATGMRALGDQHGYVVVQPNAPGVPSSWDQTTEVPEVFAFVTDLATALVTDPKRAHVMGFSEGGGMTWAMVCGHADFFASASPLAGIVGCTFVAPDVPSRAVPILQVNGTQDNVVNDSAVAVPMCDAALAYWHDGAGVIFAMDAGHTATRYLTSAGVPYELWAHNYAAGNAVLGGHCAPGGLPVGPGITQFGCEGTNQFVYGQVAMAFFMAHPLP